MTVYAIGDIHGRLDLFTRLLGRVDEAAKESETSPLIVFLGDYVDRGPDSKGVVELVRRRLTEQKYETVALRGNHEQMMVEDYDIADQEMVDKGYSSARDMWYPNGGRETMVSYGWRHDPSHVSWMRSLPYYHLEGKTLFVHAGITRGVAPEHQDNDVMLWVRDKFIRDETDDGLMVVHGHTVTREVEIRHNRVGLDTGAYYYGVLSCAVIPRLSDRKPREEEIMVIQEVDPRTSDEIESEGYVLDERRGLYLPNKDQV